VSGPELEKMTDEELGKKIDEIDIFARISPRQKLRIVEILKLKGEEIAITGDGVNDVLALKKADIGIAMGRRGSDVAREVSDMILIDDNFASIVKAVEEGRIVYDNSKKATKFLLGLNFVEIFLITYSILLRLPLPLLPLQILWINLITDSFPALALTKEKGEEVMKGKPRKEKSILTGVFWFILAASIIAFSVEIILYHYALANFTIEKTRTMVMFTIIGFSLLFVFVCRSNKPLKDIGVFSNKWITYALIVVILLQAILIYTPLAPLFSIVPLTAREWLLVLAASLPGLVVFEVFKLLRRKK
jgi:Ca2+-transporting ATPase